jgi:hypothetical protein
MRLQDVLTDESKWTQGASARDKRGNPTFSFLSDACQWCLIGATVKCCNVTRIEARVMDVAIQTAIDELFPTFSHVGFGTFNDDPERTFADIQAVAKRVDELIATNHS